MALGLYVVVMVFCRKPTTQAGRRALVARESKIIENTKQTMVMRGGKTSDNVNKALRDLVRFLLCVSFSI